jgi:hypothetical protein
MLAGSLNINDYSIRTQLMGSHIHYDIASCRMGSSMDANDWVKLCYQIQASENVCCGY